MTMAVTKSPQFELLKMVVCKLVKEPINYPREMKVAKKLVEIHPDPEFWMGFEPGFRVHCLGWFLNGRGKEMLDKHEISKNQDAVLA